MGKLTYLVASTIDGYIAGPNGEADWITPDPDVDFLSFGIPDAVAVSLRIAASF